MSVLLGLVDKGADEEQIEARYEDRHLCERHGAEMDGYQRGVSVNGTDDGSVCEVG